MLEVKNLTKTYGGKQAVQDVSFTVDKGEILGFLGPNGAGKSTTMNMITGYMAATSGEVLVDGVSVLEAPRQAKKKIGYLPEKPPLYMDMTVKEYLNFVYELKQVTLPRAAHIAEVCGLVKIEHVYERMIRNLSKGYQQRIGIAQALLGNPDLLILDEPTVGLDPKQIIEIRDLIVSLGRQQTIILSSHILSEVQAVCSRIIVISDGRLVADGTAEGLSHAMSSQNRMLVSVQGGEEEVHGLLSGLEGVTSVSHGTPREPGVFEYTIEQQPDSDVRVPLFFLLAQHRLPIMALRSAAMSLEEVFLSLTDHSGQTQEPAAEEAPAPQEDTQTETNDKEETGA